jgi:ABC-type branched-subunit amino acid transport system substrate-binding protein
LLGLVGLLVLAVFLGIWLARDGVLPSRQAEGPKDSGQKQSRPHPSFAQGVTDDEIRVGMSAPFSGDARELGRDMQLGIDTYFRSVNDRGGVDGRKLTLVALDDGYDPHRALANLQELNEQRKVFAVLGNVGTPTALKTVPYAVQHKLLFFGPFTGAKALRKVPPARYVFNYRASYEEETAKIVEYLIRVKKVRPEQVAVFAQNDSYGQDGFEGVARVLRKHGRDRDQILHVTYAHGSTDVDAAVQKVMAHTDAIRAVVMVATYRPAARFIEKVKDARPDVIFTNVSFVGGHALADELGPKYREGVIVTQVVPPLDCDSTAVLKFREQLRTYFPNERPSFVALEGYIAAAVFVEGLRRVDGDLTTERLINVLESIRDLDLGTGAPIRYGASEHQGSHKVWGTILDAAGAFKEIDLDE